MKSVRLWCWRGVSHWRWPWGLTRPSMWRHRSNSSTRLANADSWFGSCPSLPPESGARAGWQPRLLGRVARVAGAIEDPPPTTGPHWSSSNRSTNSFGGSTTTGRTSCRPSFQRNLKPWGTASSKLTRGGSSWPHSKLLYRALRLTGVGCCKGKLWNGKPRRSRTTWFAF